MTETPVFHVCSCGVRYDTEQERVDCEIEHVIQAERKRHGMGTSRRALTPEQRRALCAAGDFVLAGEWPWDDIRPETMERAIEKLTD